MRRLHILFLTFLGAVAIVLAVKFYENENSSYTPPNLPPSFENNISGNETSVANNQPFKNFIPPLDNAENRITKKPFGIFISPANSPVQPEKFSGYHTGADFEVFPDELNQEVAVKAICQGKLLSKRRASGYGGVAVQNCFFNQQPITVVYGHLKLDSIKISEGQKTETGDFLGILGKNNSAETDSERKHLHLSIHKGTEINLLGYVKSKNELSAWIDPDSLIFSD